VVVGALVVVVEVELEAVVVVLGAVVGPLVVDILYVFLLGKTC